MGAVLAGLSGINSVSGPGMLDFESCQSLEKLVLDDEICGMVARLRRGIEPRDDFPSRPLFEELLRDGAPADRRPHPEAPQGADPLLLAGHRARPARPLARGGRDDPRPAREPRGGAARRRLDAVAPPRRDEARPAGENGPRGARGGDGGAADGGGVREIVRFAKRGGACPRPARSSPPRACPRRTRSPRGCAASSTRRCSAYAALVEPRAVCEELPAERFAAVLAPLGVPGDDLVVGAGLPARRGPRPLRGDARRGAPRADPAALRRGRARRGLDARRGGLGGRRPPRRPPGRALPADARGAGDRTTRASCPTAPATAAGRPAASGRSSTRCGRRRSGSRSTTRA